MLQCLNLQGGWMTAESNSNILTWYVAVIEFASSWGVCMCVLLATRSTTSTSSYRRGCRTYCTARVRSHNPLLFIHKQMAMNVAMNMPSNIHPINVWLSTLVAEEVAFCWYAGRWTLLCLCLVFINVRKAAVIVLYTVLLWKYRKIVKMQHIFSEVILILKTQTKLFFSMKQRSHCKIAAWRPIFDKMSRCLFKLSFSGSTSL